MAKANRANGPRPQKQTPEEAVAALALREESKHLWKEGGQNDQTALAEETLFLFSPWHQR